jgi:uncharacterized protein
MEHGMLEEGKKNDRIHFKPAWWLKNKHLQTLFPVLFPHKTNLLLIREDFHLPDGDILQLDWTTNKQENKPLIVLLHGLEGSSSSPYIQRMMKSALKYGLRAVCMHFRGCGGIPNKLSRAYHAGETEDLSFFLNYLTQKMGIIDKIFIAGFSLGGNVLLKWLGENPNNKIITSAAAASVPFDLANSADCMDQGVSKIYQWWLLKCLKESILRKGNFESIGIKENEIENLKNFWEFDDKITAKIHGFLNANDYYLKSSSRQFLSKIKTPTLIIHSLDDPFMSPSCIPNKDELSISTEFELSKNGGHIGFVSGAIPFFPQYWLEKKILNYFLNFH